MFGTLMILQNLCTSRAQHSAHLTLGQRAQSQTLSTRLLYLLGRLRRPRPSAGNANRSTARGSMKIINKLRFWFSVKRRQLAFLLFGEGAQEFYFRYWEGRPAVEHKMHQTAFGVFLLVFFVGFSCGAIVFNGLCGGW